MLYFYRFVRLSMVFMCLLKRQMGAWFYSTSPSWCGLKSWLKHWCITICYLYHLMYLKICCNISNKILTMYINATNTFVECYRIYIYSMLVLPSQYTFNSTCCSPLIQIQFLFMYGTANLTLKCPSFSH